MIKQKLIDIYERLYEKRRMLILRTKYRLNIMSKEKTIKYIKSNKCSMARFGDGEFNHIFNTRGENYQEMNPYMAEKLKDVLKNTNKNLLLCVPLAMNTFKGLEKNDIKFWTDWGKINNNTHQIEVVNMIRSLSGDDYIFGDTTATRPYMGAKNPKTADKIFSLLKSIWDDRDILVVEGEGTRLSVGNDLFDNAKSVKRILAPAENAFDKYDEILKTILDNYNGELILLALGPTATILASDLSKIVEGGGVQALDVGHIDIDYEWYKRGAKEKIAIPGKYTNEVEDGLTFGSCSDEKYLSEIIARVI